MIGPLRKRIEPGSPSIPPDLGPVSVIIDLKAKVGSDPTPVHSRFQCDRC
jgi:hypothetical protein